MRARVAASSRDALPFQRGTAGGAADVRTGCGALVARAGVGVVRTTVAEGDAEGDTETVGDALVDGGTDCEEGDPEADADGESNVRGEVSSLQPASSRASTRGTAARLTAPPRAAHSPSGPA
jgi:hypothetical protein